MIFFNFDPSSSSNDVVHILFGETTSQTELVNFLKDNRTDLFMLNAYPLVRKVFVKFNTPTFSSTSVERLFNYAKMVDLSQYNRLSNSNFEKRVVGRVNSKLQLD